MRILFSAAFLLLSFSLVAQVDPVADYNRHVVSNWRGGFVRIGPYRVKGTPHLFGQSLPGSITYKGNRIVADNKIFYDIYHQKLGSDINGAFTEMNAEIIEFYVITPEAYGGKQLNFKPVSYYGKTDLQGFVEVLADGVKLSFLKYYKAIVVMDPVNAMDKEARIFEQNFDHYIFNKSTGQLNKVKLREKDILKAIAGVKGEKNIIIFTEIDFSKEADVVNVINKYNQ